MNGMGENASGIGSDPEFFRVLVENTTEGLLTIDPDSQILYANPAIEGILGYHPDELIGSSKMKIIPERLRPVHQTALNQYIQTGEKHIDWSGVELPALHKDGHEVPVSVSLREHEYKGKRIFTGIFTDISDQKEREEELKKRNKEIEKFSQLVAHDIRNPLLVAKGYTDLLSEEYDDDEFEQIQNSLSRIEEILDDTKQIVLSDEMVESRRVMTLRDVARGAWESVPTENANLELPDQIRKIRANEGRLRQLFENLFRNAVEHGGETVTVRVGVLDQSDGFYIEDDGTGIPKDIKTRLETPTGLSRERESGYGLEIVQAVCDEHEWEMTITDSESGGARFEFAGTAIVQ